MHAAGLTHYISGAYYPKKGPMEPAKQWIKYIKRRGGDLMVNADVTEIVFEGDVYK